MDVLRPGVAAVAAVLALTAPVAPAQQRAPAQWHEPGACPFECCGYGEWIARKAIPVFDRPQGRATRIGTIGSGTPVTALDGFVRTPGAPFRVHRAHRDYRVGDVLTVYDYRGEGMFNVWYDGRRFEEDLGFSPYGGTAGPRCTNQTLCWGTLARPLRMQWWANVRLPDGVVGWVRASGAFTGQGGCG